MHQIHGCNIKHDDIPADGMLVWFSCARMCVWVMFALIKYPLTCCYAVCSINVQKPCWNQIHDENLSAFGNKTVSSQWLISTKTCSVTATAAVKFTSDHTRGHIRLYKQLCSLTAIIYCALEQQEPRILAGNVFVPFECTDEVRNIMHCKKLQYRKIVKS